MSFEVPALRATQPEAIEAIRAGQQLIIEQFQAVTGADILVIEGTEDQTPFTSIAATDQGVDTVNDSRSPHAEVDVKIWLPTEGRFPDVIARLAINRIYEVAKDEAYERRSASQQRVFELFACRSSGEHSGYMRAKQTTTKARQGTLQDIEFTAGKTVINFKEVVVRKIGDIATFFEEAQAGIKL